MRDHFFPVFFSAFLMLSFAFAPNAFASSQGDADSYRLYNSLVIKSISRARSEIDVKRLRQLVAAKKIDADQLIRALQEIAGRTSQR